jgi:hypothetical protein
MDWNRKLSFPLKLKSGRWLRTCDDARDIILNVPTSLQHSERWEATAQRLMDVADGRGQRADLHYYLSQALRADDLLAPDRPTRKKNDIRI